MSCVHFNFWQKKGFSWQFSSSSVVASLQNNLISFRLFDGQLAAAARWFHHNWKELEGLVMECSAILSKMDGRKFQFRATERLLCSSHFPTIFHVNVWRVKESRILKTARTWLFYAILACHIAVWSDIKLDFDSTMNFHQIAGSNYGNMRCQCAQNQ